MKWSLSFPWLDTRVVARELTQKNQKARELSVIQMTKVQTGVARRGRGREWLRSVVGALNDELRRARVAVKLKVVGSIEKGSWPKPNRILNPEGGRRMMK